MPPNNPPHNALSRAINSAIADGAPVYEEIKPATTISMSFAPDGAIEYTRHKALAQFFGGAGNMKRVTDIQKRFDAPMFYIKWLMGPYTEGSPLSHEGVHNAICHADIFGRAKPSVHTIFDSAGTLLFRTYEDAVLYEITCLNAMREKGITFDETDKTAG